MNKALFLDRDGIVNEDFGHVHKIEDFKFCDNVFDLCREYQQSGYLIIIVTNQAGIGKGLYTLEDFQKLNKWMIQEFESNGIHISKVYYCPHKPEDKCYCRKPAPGMFLEAIKEFDLDPLQCVAIGDKMSDLQAAHQANIKTLYFKKTRYDEIHVDFDYKYLK